MKIITNVAYILVLISVTACGSGSRGGSDATLRSQLTTLQFSPTTNITAFNSQPKVELGKRLFFDKILSGKKDVSCATCHTPSSDTVDHLSLAIGTGGQGAGAERQLGIGRQFIPRNTIELFNRGHAQWRVMFFDGRVAGTSPQNLTTPAGPQLPMGLDSLLAAQALFPMTSRDEMRGNQGDIDRFGGYNELANFADTDFVSMWTAIVNRVNAIPEYQQLLTAAYPGIGPGQFTIAHIANAIAAYESDRFNTMKSPFDLYLAGNNAALTDNAKKGASLFFGRARCSTCHSGILFTDQNFHNIAVPQFGPGKGAGVPLDFGRFLQTNNPADKFAFRTPSLRNVRLTGPWMHNGAYVNLRDAVTHHLNPSYSLSTYNVAQLRPELQLLAHNDAATQQQILQTLDPLIAQAYVSLIPSEIDQLVEFLDSLTDPAAHDLNQETLNKVPSGLPIYN